MAIKPLAFRTLVLNCCLGLAPVVSQAQSSSVVETGHSALWFDLARNGEG